MRPLFYRWITAALFAMGAVASAQTTAPSADSAKEAYIVTSQDAKVVVALDDTYTEEVALSVRIQSQAGVQQLGVLSFTYASLNSKASFDYVRVRKSDGTVVETPLTGVQDQPAAATQEAPMYSDLRVIQLPVKGLSPGDTLEYKFSLRCTHVLVPNQFYYGYTFIKADTVERETLEVRVPVAMALQVASSKVQPIITTEKDERVYRWSTHNEHKQPSKEKDLDLSGREGGADVLMSTFKSWQEVGDWYSSIALPAAAVTPSIQSKADELTHGLKSDTEKITAIYNFVALQFRYIGLDFGIGRYKPHAAEDVLDNQYGDCKDKHTLLQALLRAAGYASSPVLISSDTAINTALPSPAQFDHVITLIAKLPNATATTAVPDFSKDLLVDSTSGLTPLGVLVPVLRDKQALVVRSDGRSELIRTPLLPGNVAEGWDFTSKGKLDKQGTLHASFSITWNTDIAILFRAGFRSASRADWTALMQNISYAMGFGGQISNPDISDPADFAVPMHAAYDYDREKYSNWEEGSISFPLTGFDLPTLAQGDTLKGDVYLGPPQVQHQHSELDLPQGYTAQMPSDVDIKIDGVHYQSIYNRDHLHIETDRKLTIEVARLPRSAWKSYSDFREAIDKDTGSMIVLTANNTPADSTAGVSAHDYVLRGYEALRRHDLKAAKNDAKMAQALSPDERGLSVIVTEIAREEGNMDQMRTAALRMVAGSPQNSPYVLSLSKVFIEKGKPEYAIELLEGQMKANPGDEASAAMLGGLLMDQDAAAARASTIQEIAKNLLAKRPDSGTAMLLSIYAAMLNGPAPAKPAFADAFSKQPQAAFTNHFIKWFPGDVTQLQPAVAGYVEDLEKDASTITVQAAGKEAAQQTATLVTAWETLGRLDARSGDRVHARKYLQAAWDIGEQPSAAIALGELDEAEANTPAAIHMYQLAGSATFLSNNKDATVHLQALHVKNANNQAVQEEFDHLRIIDIPSLAAKQSASADFWVIYAHDGKPVASYAKGADTLANDGAIIEHTLKPFTLPDDGPEVILRRGILGCYPSSGCQFVLMLPEDAIRNAD